MKHKNIFYIFFILSGYFFYSCQEEPEPGGTATQEIAGEWYIKYYVKDQNGTAPIKGGNYYKVMTFNTASNSSDTIWVTDLEELSDFQVKTSFNRNDKTFSISQAQNALHAEKGYIYDDDDEIVGTYAGKVTIENGKFLMGQGISSSGVKTDSIYMEILSDNDTTATGEGYQVRYIAAGHRRTGFLEDEH